MWYWLLVAMLIVWWVLATAGFVINALVISQVKDRRRHLPPDWKWSRVIANGQINAARGRGVTMVTYLALAPIMRLRVIGAGRRLGAHDTMRADLPAWVVAAVFAVWLASLAAVVWISWADMRRGHGDE